MLSGSLRVRLGALSRSAFITLACACAAWSLPACSSYWVAHATTNGRAFIARGGTMYNCDATRGRPRCWPVAEVGP